MARPHQVQVYRDAEGFWRWRRRAGNYRVIAAAEQGHRWRWYTVRKAKRLNLGVDLVVIDDEA